jgi:hypothetical protein
MMSQFNSRDETMTMRKEFPINNVKQPKRKNRRNRPLKKINNTKLIHHQNNDFNVNKNDLYAALHGGTIHHQAQDLFAPVQGVRLAVGPSEGGGGKGQDSSQLRRSISPAFVFNWTCSQKPDRVSVPTGILVDLGESAPVPAFPPLFEPEERFPVIHRRIVRGIREIQDDNEFNFYSMTQVGNNQEEEDESDYDYEDDE